MAQTTVMNLNNVAVVAANNTVNSKEETIMTANNNTQATVNVVAKEAMNMTKADLRKALEEKGITMSNVEFKATKKAELEARLAAAVAVETKKQAKMPVNPLDDPAVMGMDDEKYLIAPTVTTPVAEDEKWSKFLSKLCKEIMKQTVLFGKDGKTVVLDENNKVKLQDYALFYKPDNGYNDYAVKNNRIWAVIAKVINNKAKTRDENIILILNEMAKRDLLTISEVRTYITVKTADLSKEDKDFFRNLCASKDLKWEYAAKKGRKDESIKFTAVTENGEKELANKYGKVTLYSASKYQMKNMMMLALQK